MQKENIQSVLVTGGSGLIGMHLTSVLLEKGYRVSHLSRKGNQFGKVRVHVWDPEKKILDPLILEDVDFIIHLAGANLGEKRWSRSRKEEILKSRIDPANLLYKVISDNGFKLKAFISASGTGYYGSKTSKKIYTEEDLPSDDFTGRLCSQWERSADLFQNSGIRTVKLRTAVALAKDNPALSKLLLTSKMGFLVKAGNGQQFFPWIHITDLCNIYLKAIEDNGFSGAYNAVSPHHVTNEEFMETLGKVINKPVSPVAVPSIALKTIYGEMSAIVLEGSRISSQKIVDSGYRFLYGNLEEALTSLLRE